jgi:hypothetical protein
MLKIFYIFSKVAFLDITFAYIYDLIKYLIIYF